MPPAPTDREVVEQIATEHLPPEHRSAWLEMLRPAVRLVAAQRAAAGAPQVGRLGGLPSLPAEVAWPVWEGKGPLTFVGEVDCAALAGFELDVALPREGRLLMFYWDGRYDGGLDIVGTWEPETLVGARLLHVTEPGVPTAPPPHEVDPRVGSTYPEVALVGVPVVTYPSWEHPDLVRRFRGDLDHRAWLEHPVCADAFTEALWERRGGPAHQVGGYATPVQGPVEAEVAHAALGNPEWSHPRMVTETDWWELVVQVDTDDDAGMMWGDAGTLYWLGRLDQLKRGDLGGISFTWQCG